MPFQDRAEAGRKLAAQLLRFKTENPVVLALPRGGVSVAAEIAKQLEAPLDLLIVRKIGVPFQPELAMGAVADTDPPCVVRNADVIASTGVSDEEFKTVCDAEIKEITRRRNTYLKDRPRAALNDATAIIIDDGIATGATTRAALRAIRMLHPRKVILAVPVGPTDTIAELQSEADDIICLEQYSSFGAIGLYYRDFRQVSDREVIDILRQFPPGKASSCDRSDP